MKEITSYDETHDTVVSKENFGTFMPQSNQIIFDETTTSTAKSSRNISTYDVMTSSKADFVTSSKADVITSSKSDFMTSSKSDMMMTSNFEPLTSSKADVVVVREKSTRSESKASSKRNSLDGKSVQTLAQDLAAECAKAYALMESSLSKLSTDFAVGPFGLTPKKVNRS